MLVGARLDWMLHFGKPPRFAADVLIVQIESEPEELHHSIPSAATLLGDCAIAVRMVAFIEFSVAVTRSHDYS